MTAFHRNALLGALSTVLPLFVLHQPQAAHGFAQSSTLTRTEHRPSVPAGARVIQSHDPHFVVYRLPARLVSPKQTTTATRRESALAEQPSMDRRAAACYGFGAPSGHAYSVGFSTCGEAIGISGSMDFLSGSYALDGTQTSHVNATLWIYNPVDPTSLEVGYWKGAGGTNNCFYEGKIGTAGQYTSSCLVANQTAPTSPSFEITRAQNSNTYDFYVNGNYKMSVYDPSNSFMRIDSGVEEQSSNLSAANQSTPNIRFSSLRYQGTGGNWSDWGTYSHCFVNHGNTFGQASFPTSHNSKIGSGAGTYSGCDGSAPTSPRTAW